MHHPDDRQPGSRPGQYSRLPRSLGLGLLISVSLLLGLYLPTGAPGVPVSDPSLMHPPPKFSSPYSWKLLDQAFDRALQEPDPRFAMAEIASAANSIDSRRALDFIRRMTDALDRMHLPSAPSPWHADWNSFAGFAVFAAPYDTDLRNRFLKRAIAEADVAMKDKTRWQPMPVPPGCVPWQDPKEEMAQTKQIYTFSAEMWQCVIDQRQDAQAARAKLRQLLVKAEAKGYFGSCEIRRYDDRVLYELSILDSELLVAVLREMGETNRLQYWENEIARRQAKMRPRAKSERDWLPKEECKTAAALRTAKETMTAEEKSRWRALHRLSGNPEEQRVLERPGDTAWLIGETRQIYLQQAAALSYLPCMEIDTIKEIIEGMHKQEEIDQLLRYVVESISSSGKPAHVFELVERIKSRYIYVSTCCRAARCFSLPADDR